MSFLSFVLSAALMADVTHSITPQMDDLLREEYSSNTKYAPTQRAAIHDAIGQKSIRVITYNTLFDIYDADMEEQFRWKNRKERVIQAISEMEGAVLGLQEVMPGQLDDLCSGVPSSYDAYFGNDVGEYCPIFYDNTRFSRLDAQSFPLVQGKSELTMVKLKDLVSGAVLTFFNTHLAFANIADREAQVTKIYEIIKAESQECPVVLMGDMNTFPAALDLPSLPAFDGDYVENLLKGDSFEDARLRSLIGHLGPRSTFTNKDGGKIPFEGVGTPGVFLDHIYVSKEIDVLLHGVNPIKVDGLFPSDHMPVIAELVISPSRYQL